MERGDFPTGILLEHPMEHLPSAEAVPILEPLRSGNINVEEFRARYAIPTPVGENGLVNYQELVRQVKEFVVPDYKWLSPFFDEHHLYWPASSYDSPGQDAESAEYFRVASKFRDLDTNKLWVSRQFHNFIHLVTIPPEHPSLDVMKQVNKESRRRNYLFRIATDAITIREKLDRSTPMPLPTGGTLLVDSASRRAYQDPEAMENRREQFILQLLKHHNRGYIDLAEIAPLEVVHRDSVEESLALIAQRLMGMGLVTTRHSNKAIKVDLPVRAIGHSIWLRDQQEVA